MELYRGILYHISIIIALYTLTISSSPIIQSVYYFIALVISSLYLLIVGFKYNKDKKRFQSMCIWACAILPFAFYLEVFLLLKDVDLNTKGLYAVVIYNSFRYLFITISFIIALKNLFSEIKNFANH